MSEEERTEAPSAPAAVIEERLRIGTRRYGTIAVGLGVVALVVSLVSAAVLVVVAVQNNRNGRVLVECTTPGPREPTKTDPSTGHECYDRGRAQTGDAIVVIVDEVDRRTCLRMQSALATALNREVRLTCEAPPVEAGDAGP